VKENPRTSTKEASGISVFLLEELGDARLRCAQLKKYIDEVVGLIDVSEHRDHFFEVAGHLIYGIPDTLMKMDKALNAAAMAAAKWDYEEIKDDLRPEKADQLEAALDEVRVRRVQRYENKEASSRVALMSDRSDSAFKSVLLPVLRHDTLGALEEAVTELMMELARMRAGNGSGSLASKLSLYKPDGVDIGEWIDHVEEAMEAWFSTQKRSLKQASESPMKVQEAAAQLERLAASIDATGQIDTTELAGLISGLEGPGNTKTASAKKEIAGVLRSLSASLLDNSDPQSRPSRLTLAAALRRVLADTMDVTEKTAAPLKIRNRLHGEGIEPKDVIAALIQSADNLYDCRGETRPISQTLEDMCVGAVAGIGPLAGMPDKVYELAKRARGEWNDADRYMGVIASTMEVLARDMKMAGSGGSKSAAEEVATDSKESRFEEGKPADPTKDMSEEDAKKWKQETEAHKDEFKAASEDDEEKDAGTKAKSLVPKTHPKKYSTDEKESRFEEGKPADPTENMSDEDAKKWKIEHDKHEDKFKAASSTEFNHLKKLIETGGGNAGHMLSKLEEAFEAKKITQAELSKLEGIAEKHKKAASADPWKV
jgi:hypothetical protein